MMVTKWMVLTVPATGLPTVVGWFDSPEEMANWFNKPFSPTTSAVQPRYVVTPVQVINSVSISYDHYPHGTRYRVGYTATLGSQMLTTSGTWTDQYSIADGVNVRAGCVFWNEMEASDAVVKVLPTVCIHHPQLPDRPAFLSYYKDGKRVEKPTT